MAESGSIAPKERVNIVYKAADGGVAKEVELPLKILALADFTGCRSERPIDERPSVAVDKNSFNDVMAHYGLKLDLSVPDRLSTTLDTAEHLSVSLQFGSLKDFEPEGVVAQVPQLRQLLELRAALVALKGPMGNIPAFKKKIQNLIADDASRAQLAAEIASHKDERP